MSLIHFDSFENYNSVAQMTPPFATASSAFDSTARTGTKALLVANNGVSFVLDANRTGKVTMGYACRVEAADTSQHRHFLEVFSGIESSLQFYVTFGVSSSLLTLYSGTGAVMARSYVPFNFFSAYCYMEFQWLVDDTVGFVEIRQDENVILRFDGDTHTNGGPSATRTVGFNTSNSTDSFRVDDFYLLDDSGSELNDYLGDIRVEPVALTADDSPLDWTPDTGSTHHTQVPTPSTDAHYIESGTVGDKDTFTLNDISTGVVDPIIALMVITRAEQL